MPEGLRHDIAIVLAMGLAFLVILKNPDSHQHRHQPVNTHHTKK